MESTRSTRWTVAAILTTVAFALAACSGSSNDKAGGADKSRPRTLTMTIPSGASAQVTAFAEELVRLSKGKLKVEFEEFWRLGEADYETATLDDVKSGKIEMASVGARAFDAVGVTSFQALVAPLLIDSYDLEARIFEEGLPDGMLKGIEQLDLVGIGVLPGPMRKLLGVSQPFVRPGDFVGRVVGLQSSAVAEKSLRALGATPRAVPAKASLDGLDAYEQQLSSIDGNRYDSTAKYVTANVNLWPRPLVIVMGTKAFESLPPEQQSALRDAAHAAIAESLRASRAEDDEAAAILCRRGMTFAIASETDLAEIRNALQPVYAELTADPKTKSGIDAITSLKGEVAASAEAPSCSPNESPAGASPVKANRTPIDGVYEFTTTADELLAAGSDNTYVENYGAYRWVLDHGRFEMTQENGASDRWTKGTYVVLDDVVEFTVEEFGGIAPNGASEKPGEVFTYTWSLYRDQLTLRAVKGKISAENFLAKPWKRVG
jgi:TRAP-type C4-dicarboxylate transport system substrate-binding protein